MSKVFLVTFLVLFVGCSAVSQFTSAQKACATDEACLAEVKGYAKIGEAVASPFGPIAGGAASAIIIFAGLGIKGLIKKKKDGTNG